MKQSVVYRILLFSHRHSVLITILIAALTLLFGYYAIQIEIRPGVQTMVPDDDTVTALFEKYGAGSVISDYLVIAVESENPYTPERLAAFWEAINAIENDPLVNRSINPFNQLTFRKNGAKLEIIPMSPDYEPPESLEAARDFQDRLLADPFVQNLVVSEDGRVLSALFPYRPADSYLDFKHRLDGYLTDLRTHFDVYIAGPIPFETSASKYLVRDMPKLMALCALCILLIYFIGFRSIRAVLLPLAVVGLGTLWSMGLMQMLGLSLSIVSIVTPPLVLTLGSSYSIHIMNEYYREAKTDAGDKLWVVDSVSHINKTIILASVTTVIGFLSLLANHVQQTRQFGIATSFGIVSCAILSLFLLPNALSWFKAPKMIQQKKILQGKISRVMTKLAKFTHDSRVVIFIAVGIIIAGFLFSINKIHIQTDSIQYFPSNDIAVTDLAFVTNRLGGTNQINLTLSAPDGEKNYFLKPEVLAQVSDLEQRIIDHPHVSYAISFAKYLRELNRIMTGSDHTPDSRGLILLLSRYFKLLSREAADNRMLEIIANDDFSWITISFRTLDKESDRYLNDEQLRVLLAEIEQYVKDVIDPSIETEMWGARLRYLRLLDILNWDLQRTMLLSTFLVFIAATIAFRSPVYGAFSLIPLLTGLMLNFIFMAITKIPLDLTTVMVSSVAIGIGVDDSIHFLIQFRRQREQLPGSDIDGILAETLKITGRPILLTSASIIAGVLVLLFSSFEPIRFFGILVALALFTTTLGCLVVLPAFLSIVLRRSNRKRVSLNQDPSGETV
jgi:uncharacterized protein